MSEPISQYEIEARLIYSIIVAGKSADFADNKTVGLLKLIAKTSGDSNNKDITPFQMIRKLTGAQLDSCLRTTKTGNYTKLNRALSKLAFDYIELQTCTPEMLEQVPGIGFKTSRFFIMWIRPSEEYAALDVHVLRWMRNHGYPAPKSTPSNPKEYAMLEKLFIAEAKKRNMTAREFDMKIWEAGAGRTQETATPNL